MPTLLGCTLCQTPGLGTGVEQMARQTGQQIPRFGIVDILALGVVWFQ